MLTLILWVLFIAFAIRSEHWKNKATIAENKVLILEKKAQRLRQEAYICS